MAVTLTEHEIGGKAYNLCRIKDVRHSKFFVLPAGFLEKLPADNAEAVLILGKEIERRVSKKKKYAVRSSAVGEDSAELSYAGVMESYLNVAPDEIPQKVLDCYSSVFSIRAAEYRKINNINKPNRMAVIIQEMVAADFAGVINTVNPVTNNPDELLVSAVRGLGEKLVSGEKNSSDYIVNGDKIHCSGEPLLAAKIIRKLADMAYAVERQCKTFQDIEFAVKNGKVYFLQTRDIVPYKNIDLSLPKTILDNSNIIESYSGVVTPLTFSFAEEIYGRVFTEAFRQGNISKRALNRIEQFTQKLLVYYDGRVYYNLNNWYKMTGVFPNAKSRTRQFERMIGVNTQVKNKRVKIGLFDSVKFIFTLIYRLKRLKKDSRVFVEKFYEEFLPYSINDFKEYPVNELVRIYNGLTEKTRSWFVIPTLNDIGAMSAYAKLAKYISRFDFPDKDGYISSLLVDLGGVESALSAEMFYGIIDLILSDGSIKNDFLNLNESELYNKYKVSALSEKVNAYLLKFGARVTDELKLETVTMIQKPEILFSMLKSYIVNGLYRPEKKRVLSAPDAVFTGRQKRKIQKLAGKAGFFIRNREKMRLTRTHVFSATRNMFLRLDEQFFKKGIIENRRDIFFLTKDEVFDAAGGKGTEVIKDLIAARKTETEQNVRKKPADRIVFYGGERLDVLKNARAGGPLCGIPSGAGVVKGKVKYISDPASVALNGEIILTKRTDPGWITLFPLCAGLITENGSVLSHSAVVAREMGIPAVVGVPDAVKLIPDGATVTLDAIKGEIIVHGQEI